MNTDKIITVFGSTGTQGNAVARKLIQEGWQVRAVTREPKSTKAQALAELGAEIVMADFEDFASLTKALKDVYGVYSVQPVLTKPGNLGEARWGIAVADAAWTAQVQHFIYGSAVIGRGKRVLGLGSKRAIEERIAELSLPTTILRPVFFMENLNTHFPVETEDGQSRLTIPFPANKKLQMVSVADIAKAAALAFSDPQTYIGKSIEIVGDALTLDEMAAAWSKASGTKCSAASIPIDTLAEFWPEGEQLFRFVCEGGCDIDISKVSNDFTPMSFSEWLKYSDVVKKS